MSRLVSVVRAVVLVVGVSAVATTVAHAQVQLRWKFQPGAEYKHVTTQTVVTETDTPQGKMRTDMKQQFYTTQRILAVQPDGSAKVQVTVDRIVFELKTPMQTVTYDSATGQEPQDFLGQQFANSLKPLIDAPITAVIDPLGHIQEVELPEALKQLLAQNPAFQGNAEDIFERAGGQSLVVFPEKPVSKGDSWTETLELPLPFGTMKVTSTYTYAGTVASESQKLHKLQVDVAISSTPAENAQVSIKVQDHSGSGEVYIASDLTHMVRASMHMEMTLELTVQNQKLIQTISTDTTVRLLNSQTSNR